ncbi:MAG: OmpP1/FadL family transporter [Burkholderiales bacterium]
MKLKKLFAVMAVAGLAAPGAAMATNGMFASGYGMAANGMGGASAAMAEDTMGGANNPASMVFVGNRMDLGAYLFSPQRQASVGGTPENSDANYFVIPEFGYNKLITSNLSLGVSVYGNGGMNTDYAPIGGGRNLLGGYGNLGVNLEQMIIAPTLAYKINDRNSIGISPLIGYERFSAQGIQGFDQPGMSANPSRMTNTGNASAFGGGVRIGYMGKITPDLTFGADYSTKVSFAKLSQYSGLFAGQGSMDLPENFTVGLAYKVQPALTVALDYERINYSGVAAIGDQSTAQTQFGSSYGPGFGWQDVNVWKLGAEYQYNEHWILRTGWNHGDDPITATNIGINVLAPGVITDHFTMGASYLTGNGEWNAAYTHGFNNSLSGNMPAAFGGAPVSISMHQDIVGLSYAWKM